MFWFALLLPVAFVAYVVIDDRRCRRRAALKERAESFGRLSALYDKLVEEDACVLTHEADFEIFRREAKRWFGPETATKCLDVIGTPRDALYRLALQRVAEEAATAKKLRPVRPLREYVVDRQ